MGWTCSGDMKQQVRLAFDTKEEAIAYCERHGIAYQVFESTPRQARAHLLFRQFRLRAGAAPGRTNRRAAGAALRRGRFADARAALPAFGLARWRNSEMKRSSGIGWPSRKPWP